MGQPDDRHLGGHHRVRRRRHLLERLQQHLPHPRQRPHRQPRRRSRARAPARPARPSGRRPPRARACTIDTQCVTSARSRSTAIGSAPAAYCAASSASAARASPRHHRARRGRAPARGRRARASPAPRPPSVSPAPCAIAWSSSDSASRTDPSDARAISASASGATLHPLGRRDPGEVRQHRLRLDPPQVEPLAARQHRHRHLADLGGGEDELHVRRRLLQRLQQRVERRGAQHVHLVDDVDLVARARRPVGDRRR